MKKNIFYVCLLIIPAFSVYCNPLKEITTNSKFSTKLLQNEPERNSWKLNSDIEIALKGVAVKTSWTSDSVIYSEQPQFHKPALGIVFMPADFIKVPFYFKFGQLNACGSSSKLNTGGIDYLSTPLKSSSIAMQTLSVNMPTASAYKKAFAGNFSLNYKPAEGFLKELKFSIFTDEEEKSICSSSAAFSFSKRIKCGLAFTTGRFFISSENSSWYSIIPYFPKNWQLCHNLQCFFSFAPILCKLNFFIYENGFTFSADNSIKIGNFACNFFFFNASSPQIFTANGNHLKTTKQIKINPQFTFFAGNAAKIRSGLAAFAEEKIQSDGTFAINAAINFSTELKTKTLASLLTFKITSINLNESFQNIFDVNFEDENIFEKSSYYSSISASVRTKLSPSFLFSWLGTPNSDKNTWKATSKLKIGRLFPLNIKTDFSISTKENELYDSSLILTASWSVKQKKLHITAAFSINYDFY